MKIENTEVYGFNASIRGIRNPKNSWDKSDSKKGDFSILNTQHKNFNTEGFILGEADKKLSQQLTKAGSEHCKHLRLINVWFDVTAPRYWYTEFDTYKHKENISTSTMHKITSRLLTQDDFEEFVITNTINDLNEYIKKYKIENDKNTKDILFKLIKDNLPEGYLQKRTVCTNYQTLYSIYYQRNKHRLIMWKEFCNSILSLPYFIELTGLEV